MRSKVSPTSPLIGTETEKMDLEVKGTVGEVSDAENEDWDLILEEEYDDDETKSDADRAILRNKRGKRKALKERRLLAVSSIDGIIDFWKQILVVSGLTPSGSERALQGFVDETHDFDPYAFKRRTITTLMRYLPAMWGHEDISSLPPSTVRNLLDLMQVALKSLQDSKLFPLQSAVSERDRLRTTIITPSVADGVAGPIPTSVAATAGSSARRRAAAANVFRVSEGAVGILADMGFRDEDVRRLAVAYRTNSVTALTNHLLEYGSGPGPGADPANRAIDVSAILTVDSDAVAATSEATTVTNTDLSTYSHSVPDPETSATSALDPLTAEAAASAMQLIVPTVDDSPVLTTAASANASASISAVSGSGTAVSSGVQIPLTVTKPLPSILRRPTEELHRDKAVLQTVFQKVFRMVPLSCLRLIERGVVSSGGEWGIEVSSVNQVSHKGEKGTYD